MPFQSVPDCAEAVIQYTANGVQIVNRLTFAFVGGGYGQEDIDALADLVMDWAVSEVKAVLSSSITLDGVTARGLENEEDFESTDTTGNGAGAVASQPNPNNVTWALKFLTGVTGRSARGRMFIPPPPIAALQGDENRLLLTHAQAWIGALEGLSASLGASGWFHVVVSRFHEGAQRETAVYRAVSSYDFTDLVLDSQRGRLPTA